MLKNKSKILIFSLSILLIPFIAQGASLVMDCYATGNCGFCDALNLVTKIANYIIGLSGVAALLMFLYAGLTLITSKGNSAKISSATKIMINAVIGMFVIYIAWAGVNYLIYTLTDGKQTGKGVSTVFKQSWQTFTCEKKPTAGDIIWRDVEVTNSGNGGGWETSTAVLLPVSAIASCTRAVTDYSGGVNPFPNGRHDQAKDVSPALQRALTCMKDTLDAGAGGMVLKSSDIYITSISDSAGIENCSGAAWTDPKCAHAKNSCHYGGSTPTTPPQSYAVDIRSQYFQSADQAALLKQLVEKAGCTFRDETNRKDVNPHYHASVSDYCGGQ
ncbi:MAG TPA: pilin [bacterium]|nr:pilin [bacterium]